MDLNVKIILKIWVVTFDHPIMGHVYRKGSLDYPKSRER